MNRYSMHRLAWRNDLIDMLRMSVGIIARDQPEIFNWLDSHDVAYHYTVEAYRTDAFGPQTFAETLLVIPDDHEALAFRLRFGFNPGERLRDRRSMWQ